MSTAAGFNIAGISGAGKSFSIDRTLKLLPQVIHHAEFRGRPFTHSQVVWLKIDCPFDGNPRGLCISFFKAIDSLLGTNYRGIHAKRRRIQTELLSDMATVAGNHYLGALVIDEIQRLSLARSGGADLLLNFFVQVVNEIGVPVVLVGTYKALAVLSREFSQLRRGGQGDLIWDRMQNDEQWKLFTKSLFRAQYTRRKFNVDDAEPASSQTQTDQSRPHGHTLGDVLYDESQGITDLAGKMYMFAQERAIDTEKEVVTANIIRSVARDKFAMLREVLRAIRDEDKRALARWDDVYPLALKEYLASTQSNGLPPAVINGKLALSPEIRKALEGTDAVVPTSVPEPETQAAATLQPVNNVTTKSGSSSDLIKPKTRAHVQGVLPGIISALDNKEGDAAYEALKKAGHIYSVNDHL